MLLYLLTLLICCEEFLTFISSSATKSIEGIKCLIVAIEDEIVLNEGIILTAQAVINARRGKKFSKDLSERINDIDTITITNIAINSKNNLGNVTINP